ncbi:M20/M25/M40 family metallo-hydrolase [Thermoleophilia bacterium SCSIO 60948]|nr:M20/M25/M40 family metallo-hydrolase [Thermoleophilia bacterium SCSIO 60948]
MDERALTERLLAYDTSKSEGIKLCAGFIEGWLDAREIEVRHFESRGLPVLWAEIGPPDPVATVIFHGHVDVVPGREEQFVPRVEGDRLIGRGAYDMKGGLACLLLALADVRDDSRVRVRMAIVPDEESEDGEGERGGDCLIANGFGGDFAITGEPTDLQVGVAAKGVLAMRLLVEGRAAHGATPWLGENAILRAIDTYRRIQALPFASRSSRLFERPSINLGRILGGDALNKVPDICAIDVDVRYLPEQDPQEILAEVGALPDSRIVSTFEREPANVDPTSPFVETLCSAASAYSENGSMPVGRDGASDAVSFLRAGIPAVEFGPTGGGHHGPDEWVSVESLGGYRRALGDFVRRLPERLEARGEAATA